MADSFDSSPGFRAVLDEACKSFVNAVPQASEWLARYAHCLLDKVSSEGKHRCWAQRSCCCWLSVVGFSLVVCGAGGDNRTERTTDIGPPPREIDVT